MGRIRMEIMSFVFILIFLLIFYFKFMSTSRFISASFIFFYKNLIKKKSKLNLLFFNKKCNIEHPRLKPIAMSFFIGLLIAIMSLMNIIFYFIFDNTITKYIGISLMILLLITLISSLIYCEISNRKSEKDFENYSQEQLNKIQDEIEKEWPNFFSN